MVEFDPEWIKDVATRKKQAQLRAEKKRDFDQKMIKEGDILCQQMAGFLSNKYEFKTSYFEPTNKVDISITLTRSHRDGYKLSIESDSITVWPEYQGKLPEVLVIDPEENGPSHKKVNYEHVNQALKVLDYLKNLQPIG